MKTKILFVLIIVSLTACKKNPANSSSVNYNQSDIVGAWIGTARGDITLDLSVDSEGNVTGSGVRSLWSIDNKGKVTGGGSFSFSSGGYLTVAGASWSLQLNSNKTKLSGEYNVAYSSLHDMEVDLAKD